MSKPGRPDRVLTTPSTGTMTRPTAIAVASGTEAATATTTDLIHETSAEIDASHRQALVRMCAYFTA